LKEIRFVDVGEGITEGHIQKWLVNDGDQVKEDESVLQVETDKAVVNVPAPIDGFIKIVAKSDTIVKVGDLIAQIGTKEELAAAPSQQAAQPQPQKQTQQPQQPQTQQSQTPPQAGGQARDVITTPYVRKIAKDLNVDLSQVMGTGPNGRIVENDVRTFATKANVVQESPKPAPQSSGAAPQSTAAPQPQQTQAAAPAPTTVGSPIIAEHSSTVPKFSETLEEKHQGEIERIPMSMTRKAIARNMLNAWTIPSATHTDLVNATKLFNIVAKAKPILEKEQKVHLTFLPFIIKATIAAIKENPNFNASYDHETLEIIRKNYYNIGIAAEAPDGLKVMVVKDADKKTIVEMAKEIQELAEKVRNQTITLEEMQDSTFTITNTGSLGGGFIAIPIINYPNVAILGTTKIRDWPMVEDGMIKIGKMMPFSLVFDHRVVDGAEAVKFGNALIKYLEDPDLLEML